MFLLFLLFDRVNANYGPGCEFGKSISDAFLFSS